MHWTFIGGLVAGYALAYFKYVFDAEKSRFEFRTKILREVWETVFFAKSCSVNLDPQMDEVDPNETREQKIERRMKEFLEAHLKAKRIVRFNQPFFPSALHDLADSVLLESMMNSKLVGDPARRKLNNYGERVDEYKDKMDSLTDKLSDDIREEVNRPAFVPFKQCKRLWDSCFTERSSQS